MTRRNNDVITQTLVILTTVVLVNFIKDVHKYNQWKNFFKTTIPLIFVLWIACSLSRYSGMISAVISITALISYIVYWHKILSKNSICFNAQLWKQREWWWGLDGWQFEQEVANVFRQNGYNAKVTKGSGDGGVDIILRKNGLTSIVQCKHYRNPVPPEPIRALWGVKNDFNADEVILVASSGITESGMQFVRNKPNFRVLNLDDIIHLSQASYNNPIQNSEISEQSPEHPLIIERKRIKEPEQIIEIENQPPINIIEHKTHNNYGRKIDI